MTLRPSSLHIAPVIAVTDLSRARTFYEDKLGLTGSATPGGWAVAGDYGTLINLLPDVPDAGSASWPAATIRVEDIYATVRDLRSRDVPFLGDDDLPFALDEDGISTQQDGILVAWIRDPDGSVLTIYSLTPDG
ncbi:VOC family protein [Ornithinimicrobium sp. INDO-MA30-4]|uniref:VOC family protein n=1 Tax=Ornithinimicrobium sp. INDO-MA30-4 TaxID=2908651 RepID=UPI001F380097|nr:VOC family protein [Ornithinimicrobium sp. INDO-MA30-4]UJH71195.1 VOC family protein [Ornithinimicrobium sp. INDO-MA30-4]